MGKNRVKDEIELLAPAKNFMAIKASAPYADAVYFGVQSFNMRMNADNFSLEDLPKIAEMCHIPQEEWHRKRKAFLTTNILIYDKELDELERVIQAAKNAHIDAVIVHDVAAIQIAKEVGIPFHISTQCNVSNVRSAKFYESLGAERIILARENSLEQIKQIADNLDFAQIEAFIHGAMCSSISGRCYLSQTIACNAGKSANRGLCTQPCRREWKLSGPDDSEFIYDGERIFNSRDLCMIAHIPKLVEAGIQSFKIEGRMRHPHYVETVSQVYREAIDAYFQGEFEKKLKTERWITRLKEVYNRGFTTGFYFNNATIKDSQLKNPANSSHFRYIELGRVLTCFKDSKIAQVRLTNGSLHLNDEIIVMSTEPGYETYFKQIVKDLRVNGKDVEKSPPASIENPVKVTLKLDSYANSKKIDAIYKFTDKTYQKGTSQRKGKRGKKPSYRLS